MEKSESSEEKKKKKGRQCCVFCALSIEPGRTQEERDKLASDREIDNNDDLLSVKEWISTV